MSSTKGCDGILANWDKAMRLRIRHTISATFEEPASLLVRSLRMSPRTFNGQYVRSWRVEIDRDCRQHRTTDAFGNIVHDFTVQGPVGQLDIVAAGEVEVDDTAGVLKGSLGDHLPPEVYLRKTPLTEPDAAIHAVAAAAGAESDGSPLDACHRLMHALNAEIEALPPTLDERISVVSVTAAACLSAKKGSPAARAHLYIAAARSLGIPARFVSGYIFHDDARDQCCAAHAWAEALIAGLGWVGFDIGADSCPTDRYVRIASAVDQPGAAWIRATDRGGSAAKVEVASTIACVGS